LRGGPVPPHHCRHPGLNRARAERLPNEIIRTNLQSHHLVDLVRPGRNHDDVGVGEFAQPAADLHTVQIRKLQLQRDKVRAVFLDLQEAFGSGTGLKDGEALQLKCPADEESHVVVALYNHSAELTR
jgi:hypothetical protein